MRGSYGRETEQRLYARCAWRFARVREHFSEEEIVNFSLAIITINGWNRLTIPFRSVRGATRQDPRRAPAPARLSVKPSRAPRRVIWPPYEPAARRAFSASSRRPTSSSFSIA